jgi:hypothetical protein
VLNQFLYHPIDSRDELIGAYILGNRLVNFLSTILPSHGEYYTPCDVAAIDARERSRSQKNVVTKYLEQIAFLIDKQEHNNCTSPFFCPSQIKKDDLDSYAADVFHSDKNYEDFDRNLAAVNTGSSDSTERATNTTTFAIKTLNNSSDSHSHFPNTAYKTREKRIPKAVKWSDTLEQNSTNKIVSCNVLPVMMNKSIYGKKLKVNQTEIPMVRKDCMASQPTKWIASSMNGSMNGSIWPHRQNIRIERNKNCMASRLQQSVCNIVGSRPPKQKDPPNNDCTSMLASSWSESQEHLKRQCFPTLSLPSLEPVRPMLSNHTLSDDSYNKSTEENDQCSLSESFVKNTKNGTIDLSTKTDDSMSLCKCQDEFITNCDFASDNIDYALPLHRSSSRKLNPLYIACSPWLPPWSFDNEIANRKHDFGRQSSTISIDSEEFLVAPMQARTSRRISTNRDGAMITLYPTEYSSSVNHSLQGSSNVRSPCTSDLTCQYDNSDTHRAPTNPPRFSGEKTEDAIHSSLTIVGLVSQRHQGQNAALFSDGMVSTCSPFPSQQKCEPWGIDHSLNNNFNNLQKNWACQGLLPNEDDWEGASLLMVGTHQDNHKFKSCIRCLLQ